MITRKEAFEIMRSKDQRGKPTRFSLKVVKLDKKRKTGGEIVTYEKVTLSGVSNDKKQNHQPVSERVKATKAPNHFSNATINVVLPNNEVRKVHVPLILRINDIFIY